MTWEINDSFSVGLPGDKIYMKPRINLNPFGSSKSEVSPSTIDEKSLADIMPFIYDDSSNIDDNDYDKQINNQDSSMRTFRNKMICVPKVFFNRFAMQLN